MAHYPRRWKEKLTDKYYWEVKEPNGRVWHVDSFGVETLSVAFGNEQQIALFPKIYPKQFIEVTEGVNHP